MGTYELERYYYRCDGCGAMGWVGDEMRGDTEFTQLAEEQIAIAGKENAFAKAAKLLKRLGLKECPIAFASDVPALMDRLGIPKEVANGKDPDKAKYAVYEHVAMVNLAK
jgi:hypothetical protein